MRRVPHRGLHEPVVETRHVTASLLASATASSAQVRKAATTSSVRTPAAPAAEQRVGEQRVEAEASQLGRRVHPALLQVKGTQPGDEQLDGLTLAPGTWSS